MLNTLKNFFGSRNVAKFDKDHCIIRHAGHEYTVEYGYVDFRNNYGEAYAIEMYRPGALMSDHFDVVNSIQDVVSWILDSAR